jgi:hypothetical protein
MSLLNTVSRKINFIPILGAKKKKKENLTEKKRLLETLHNIS